MKAMQVSVIMAIAAAASIVAAQEKENDPLLAVSPAVKEAPAVEDKRTLKELAVDEGKLKALKEEKAKRFMELHRRLWDLRDKALKQDHELQALQAEIAAKQAALEKRLKEKRPEIAKLAEEEDALRPELAEIDRQLLEIRQARQKVLEKEKAGAGGQ